MMLENSLPTNFVGKDGFYWWIGQVEKHDVKNSNRYKVRIVGHHLKDCNAVAVDDLPWAITMLPVTTPYRTGNSQGASANLRLGDWVMGFFMDGAEGQQPVIMGSVGATANATQQKPSTDPNPGGCKAFTTYLPNDHVPALDEPNKNAKDTNKNLAGTHTAAGGNQIASEALLARCGDRSAANPFGTKFCVPLNDGGKCDNAPSNFERILSELMLAVQDSGGQLGSYLINKYTGGLYSYVDQAQGAINKIFAICKSLFARLKGELVKLIRKGVDSLLQAILTPKSGGLKSVVEFLKKQLDKIGCSIDGLLDRLLKFLTDLIMGYILNIINAATCQVDNFLNTLTNQIQNLMNEFINSILGPLQSILNTIAAPLNIIGQAMSYVMNLLGITCTGLTGCNTEKESCTDGNKKKKNVLDDILAAIEDGELASPSYCQDALNNPLPLDTTVAFVGGTPASSPTTGITPTPTGSVVAAPAATYVVAPNISTAYEGDTIYYTISTTQIPDGTVLHYSFTLNNSFASTQITGAAGTVLSSSATGTATVTSNLATLAVQVVDDAVFELEDTLTIEVLDITSSYTAATADVTIAASDPLPPTYPPITAIIDSTLVISLSSSSSASPVIFSASTPSASSWSVTSNNGFGLPIVFDGAAVVTASIYVSPASALPTYKITADKKIVKPGETITFTITTTNVVDNTKLDYVIFGPNITINDFYNKTTIGTFPINLNNGVVPITIADEVNLTGLEPCTFALSGIGVSSEFYIQGNPAKNIGDTIIPAFVPPTACPAQVDSAGKILSIGICGAGNPYLDPPTVVINGRGYGAAAVAELDGDGYVSKINILRPGTGYKTNDNGNRCILTDIIPIQVGFNYTTEPTVYIDGDSTVARAMINDNGQVVSFEIVDKARIYSKYPTVEIFGDGTGSIAIAKIDCYPEETINKIKIETAGGKQTGSYIDCP